MGLPRRRTNLKIVPPQQVPPREMHGVLLTAGLVAVAAGSESRVLPPPPRDRSLDPYPYLSGGAFTGPALPFTPDPLGRYQWNGAVNASQLQVFYLLPETVTLMPGTAPASFVGWESLSQPWPSVLVSGAGSLQFDFGVENAAWLEFDSPDLAPSAADLFMGISGQFRGCLLCAAGDCPDPHSPPSRIQRVRGL